MNKILNISSKRRANTFETIAKKLKIIPPSVEKDVWVTVDSVIDLWQQDYETMRETMIYGNSLSFNVLIDKIKQLNERINNIIW